MEKLAPTGSAVRPALTPRVSGSGATLGSSRPRRDRGSLLGAAGLFAVALFGLTGCAADVPATTTNQDQGVVALFNPGASPPIVPSPTDLVRVGGKLQIPVDPTEAKNGALKTFNTYLRGLDGFPPDSTAETTFSDAVDSASLADGVVVYDVTAKTVLTAPDVVPTLDAATGNKQLTISTKSRWRNGHTYFVGLFSWQEGTEVKGLRSATAKPVLTDAAFAILRSTNPIYAKCQDPTNAACACPNLTDTACHAVVDGLLNAQAQQLEVARLGIQPLIDTVVALKGRMRNDLVLGFSFTISQRSFATFDLSRSQAPFPSSLLLSDRGANPVGDALVQVPILPTDDARTQALKGGLNTLDGFSTTGSVQFPIDSAINNGLPVDINSATVLPGKTAFLVNLSVPTKQPTYSAAPLHALLDVSNNVSGFAGQVWVTPSKPLLGDRTTYAAVLTTSIKDAQGAALVPSPITLLITQSSSLVLKDDAGVATGSAVPTISFAQAQQLEQLRVQLVPLVTQLSALGINPATVAAVTVYRTQSIVKPLQTLIGATAQLAAGGAIPTTVSLLETITTIPAPYNAAALGAIIHGTLTVRRVVDLRGPFNTARLAASLTNNEDIPFVLTLPNPALAPSGAPIIIAQHGLGRWRGDTMALATTLASKGMAMIAIDAIYHGGRVVCLTDADCATGVTCTAPAPTATLPGKCVGGAYKAAVGATVVPGFANQTPNLIPDSSLPSRDFNNFANPFAQRDNFRQHTLDLMQVVRVLQDTTTAQGLTKQLASSATLATLNPAKIGYFGQSLGAIMGTNFLAMSKDVTIGALNVGGGYLVDIYTDPRSLLSASVATALGVVPGTPAYFSLKENFRWIMDPADPINLARYVRAPDATFMPGRTAAKVILQEAGNDSIIPNDYTLALGNELGLPVDASKHLMGIDQEGGTPSNVSTFFAAATHGAIFDFVDAALTLKIQLQAATYLATGLGGAPPTVLP